MQVREIMRLIFCIAIGLLAFWTFFGNALVSHFPVFFFHIFVTLYFTSGFAMIIFCVMVFMRWNDEPEVAGILFLTFALVFLFAMIGATFTLETAKADVEIVENSVTLEFWENVWYVVRVPFYDYEIPVTTTYGNNSIIDLN